MKKILSIISIICLLAFSLTNKAQPKKQHYKTDCFNVKTKLKNETPITSGLYKIKINQTGKYLAVENISTAIGARLVQWDYVNQSNHKFFVTKNADGSYYIAAKHSGKYICADKGYKQDGDFVIQNVLPEQLGKWHFTYTNKCGIGWNITYNKTQQALHLAGGGSGVNGTHFELRTPQYHDGDLDCNYTFVFEKLNELGVEKQPTEKVIINKGLNGVIKKN